MIDKRILREMTFTSYQQLDKKWNCSYVINKHYRKYNDIGIIHYKGRVKPWHNTDNIDNSDNIHTLYKNLWLDYNKNIIS